MAVDVDRFLRELPQQLEDVSRFAEILEAVPGLAQPNNLALLNVAARCLNDGESYVEVGTYHGTSLISAMLDNKGDFVAIDNWSMGDGSREQLDSNLERYGLHATMIEGDAFETLRSDALEGRTVGVYYYDNGHEYEQQLDGMRLIEPYLASPALVIVDDTDWERVEQAVDDYLEQQPRATEIYRVDGKDRGHPEWWEGMRVLRWSRGGTHGSSKMSYRKDPSRGLGRSVAGAAAAEPGGLSIGFSRAELRPRVLPTLLAGSRG